mmetsp:Transcript_2472/g.5531  ORF Transcript_2472/g.5531 Transcript_2472/m.5531 type:complete len:252 (+) Transcript_2472:1812-2567(+)
MRFFWNLVSLTTSARDCLILATSPFWRPFSALSLPLSALFRALSFSKAFRNRALNWRDSSFSYLFLRPSLFCRACSFLTRSFSPAWRPFSKRCCLCDSACAFLLSSWTNFARCDWLRSRLRSRTTRTRSPRCLFRSPAWAICSILAPAAILLRRRLRLRLPCVAAPSSATSSSSAFAFSSVSAPEDWSSTAGTLSDLPASLSCTGANPFGAFSAREPVAFSPLFHCKAENHRHGHPRSAECFGKSLRFSVL